MSNILQINQRDYVGNDLGSNVIVNDLYDYQEIDITVQENERGPRGIGIPQGGNPGQILVKNSQDDFSVVWQDKPVANDGTLTIQKNGSTVQTFTANSDVNKTANIEVPTKTSDLANDSGYQTAANVSSAIATHNTSNTAHSDIRGEISAIDGLIPNQASTSNQLADKNFVNSSVQTATANFRGNWTDWADVPTVATDYPADYAGSKTPTVNDYLVVQDASDYTLDTLEGTWRFKYTGTWSVDGKAGWNPEYQVNETPLTAAQLAALNSGITQSKVDNMILNTDYANATTGAAGVIKVGASYGTSTSNTGYLAAATITAAQYGNYGNGVIFGKGTFENILPTKALVFRSALTSSSNLNNLAAGIYPVENLTHSDLPVAGAMFGTLLQYPDTYKTQLLIAGEAASSDNPNNLYYRRWLTSTNAYTAWQSASGSSITVDSALDNTSTNPVQNQALYPAIVGSEIRVPVYTSSWSEPAGNNPYNSVAIITLPTGTFTDNSLIELTINDQFNVFAKYGFVLYGHETETQRVWITSIGKPTSTVYLTFRIYKYGS